MAKKTISATIDQQVVEKLNTAAKTHHISRSQLLEICIESWFNQETLAQLKEGYQTHSEILKHVSESAWDAQQDVLSAETW